jgi:hypothetical protein
MRGVGKTKPGTAFWVLSSVIFPVIGALVILLVGFEWTGIGVGSVLLLIVLVGVGDVVLYLGPMRELDPARRLTFGVIGAGVQLVVTSLWVILGIVVIVLSIFYDCTSC